MSEWLAPEDVEEHGLHGLLASDDVAPGTRLGRYEILLPVAAGGMARVWAARMTGHRGFSKLVAIKTILPHLARTPEFERMFLDEARIAAEIHHPNVCEVHELGEEGNVLYLAMEWVNGDSLFHILRSESAAPPSSRRGDRASDPGPTTAYPLEPRIAARLMADACAGLHAAHSLEGEEGRLLGVVHQDVSPQNILVTLDGHTKVADFGVARALGQAPREEDAAAQSQLRGKLHYMSPEQISQGTVDKRSDVFALGCVLYEAVTGHRAFDAMEDHLVLQQVMACRPVPPSARLEDFPTELEQIIARAMAPHPAQRFTSAERMRIALEQWLAKSGSLVVTQADVARAVRARVGPKLERRKERLKQALAAMGEADAMGATGGRVSRASMPSSPPEARVRQASPSHSGVKQMGSLQANEALDAVRASLPSTPPHPDTERELPVHVYRTPHPSPLAAYAVEAEPTAATGATATDTSTGRSGVPSIRPPGIPSPIPMVGAPTPAGSAARPARTVAIVAAAAVAAIVVAGGVMYRFLPSEERADVPAAAPATPTIAEPAPAPSAVVEPLASPSASAAAAPASAAPVAEAIELPATAPEAAVDASAQAAPPAAPAWATAPMKPKKAPAAGDQADPGHAKAPDLPANPY